MREIWDYNDDIHYLFDLLIPDAIEDSRKAAQKSVILSIQEKRGFAMAEHWEQILNTICNTNSVEGIDNLPPEEIIEATLYEIYKRMCVELGKALKRFDDEKIR